jgi:epoxyqueuosine reductase
MASPEERVLEIAREVGFDLAGLAPLAPPRDAGRFDDWLAAGHHGGMGWLPRSRERIVDPARLLGTRPGTILSLGLGHSRPGVTRPDGARVARYAAGRDYHNTVGKLLKRLRGRLAQERLIPADAYVRQVVDAGPLLERSHAGEAGLGFASKAANLLHPDFGPWFFLAELLLPIELAPTTPGALGSCGTCTACLDACPTAAIARPGVVDARRCISYQTIENRGSIPRELRAGQGAWIFGCDVCSEVCPWGQGQRVPDLTERFGGHRAIAEGDLVAWVTLDDEGWEELTRGSPLRRARRAGLARNAAIVLGNVPSEGGRRALLRALGGDPAPSVREAAGWALARAHGSERGTRAAIEAARAREADAGACADLERTLAEL